ncbi:mitochondrial carrier [Dendrothele bispora CBS 962.96]|uniref:Mitochondrial carrier n=1 Tax=Dendrothele bispora (strain CBS 962.96) TaxID=1314807 RepID=A0A4V4HIC2_DENBC|nr:mitochondrial carrier [Dendrothele bispora CBS 962.96]
MQIESGPSSTWSFNVHQPPPNTTQDQPGPSSSFQWPSRPTRPPHNSIFDLSPDLNDSSDINVTNLLRALVASAVLQYTSTAIAMPWEVGKLLLQVQWVPRYGQESEVPSDAADDEDALSDSSNENDSYFADPEATPTIPQDHHTHEVSIPVRRAIDDGEYTIPVGRQDGVWGMIKRVGRFREEGWLALWKGLLTSCTLEIFSSTFQPIVHNVLQSIFLPSRNLYYPPPIILPVASHLLTGLILSPLDLVRTRLIVQSSNPRYRRYSGPIDALSQILREEGGLGGIYTHPQLLIPAVIDNTLRPLVSLALPGIIASYIGSHITEESNPIAWGIAELAGSCLSLLVTLPFETIRRRLQVQTRGTARPINGCVQLRPAPYNGVVDTFWHIVTEERSDLPPQRHRRMSKGASSRKEEEKVAEEEGWFRNTGIGQLYRGLGMRLGASIIVFALASISGEDADSGWAEL